MRLEKCSSYVCCYRIRCSLKKRFVTIFFGGLFFLVEKQTDEQHTKLSLLLMHYFSSINLCIDPFMLNVFALWGSDA